MTRKSSDPRQMDLFSQDDPAWSPAPNLTPTRICLAREVRDRVADSFLEPMHALHELTPIAKAIHFGTGTGKTYQASRLAQYAVEQHMQLIFTSTTRALVAQAKAAFEVALVGTGIPVYICYGIEDHWTDDIIRDIAGKAVTEVLALEKSVNTVRRDLWRGFKVKYDDMTQEDPAGPVSFEDFLSNARYAVDRLQALVAQAATGDLGVFDTAEEFEVFYRRRKNLLSGSLNKLCRLATRLDIEQRFTQAYAPSLGLLCRRLFPLDYALVVPGPVIMTHTKFMVGPDLAMRSTKRKRSKPTPNEAPSPVSHVLWMHFLNTECRRGCMLILDEEEDSYGILFEALTGFIDAPEAWLPSITRLSLAYNWAMVAYAPEDRGERQLIFDHLSDLLDQREDLEGILQQQRNREIDDAEAQIQIKTCLGLPVSTPAEAVAGLYDWLQGACRDALRKDVCKGRATKDFYYGLEYAASCWLSIRSFKQFIEKHTLYADLSSQRDRFLKFMQDVCSKQQLLIKRDTLAQVGPHLQYLFFDERLRLVDQAMLNHIYVTRNTDNGGLELAYRPEGKETGDIFNLTVLLKMLLWSAVVITDRRLKILPRKKVEREVTGLEYEMAPLHDLRGLFSRKSMGLNLLEAELEQLESAPDRVITDHVIFEEAKGFFSLSVTPQSIRNEQYLSARFSAYALTRSPESVVLSAARGPLQEDVVNGPYRNIVYFMSATSGIGAAFEYDRSYVPQVLKQVGGAFYGFTDAEADITRMLREEFSTRKYEVGFFTTEGKASGAGRLMGVMPINPTLLKAALPPPFEDLQYQYNRHKQTELATFYDALAYLVEQPAPHAGMFFTQNARHIQTALETGVAIGSLGVRKPDDRYAQIYEIDPAALDLHTEDRRPVVVVVFDARFLKKLRQGLSGLVAGMQMALAPLGTIEEESPELEDTEVRPEDLDGLQKALLPYSNLDKNKLFFVSRYISASRGLSLSAYCGTLDNARDYNFMVLANHRFYDSFLIRHDGRSASPEKMIAALKQLRDAGELGVISLSEFAKQLYQNPYDLLSRARLLEHFANILQTAGRVDRGNPLPSVQRLFVTADYVPDLVEGAQVTNFLPRAAKLPQALILGAQDYHQRQCPVISDFDTYFFSEAALAQAFLELIERFKHDLFVNPDPAARRKASLAWAKLRKMDALSNPLSYKTAIETMDWPYEEATRQTFLGYTYLNPAPFGGNPALLKELHIPDLVVGRECVRVLADPAHAPSPAGRTYRPVDLLFSRPLLSSAGGNDYTRLVTSLGLEPDKLFLHDLPRPHFLTNFIKGFVGEFLIERALQEAGVALYPDDWAIDQGIFERFDRYGRLPSGRLFACDSKHWSQTTSRNRTKILKAQAVEKARYVSDQLGESPLFLYINVLGGPIEAPYYEAGFDIEFLGLCNDQHLPGQLSGRFRQLFHTKRAR